MEIEIIETIVIKHTITISKNWPQSSQDSKEEALKELESATRMIGFDSIHKKSETVGHGLEHNGEIFAD
jgi:hypothetical protein